MSWDDRKTGQARGHRRGEVFPVRLLPEQRAELESAQRATAGPEGLGPWLVWAARSAWFGGILPRKPRKGITRSSRVADLAPGITRPGPSPVLPAPASPVLPELAGSEPKTARIVLDLCAGSGAWSEPYKAAGYDVRRITLPDGDVRTYVPPAGVWGVVAAPPCTEFSCAKNGQPRQLQNALELVLGCLRIIAIAQPRWWALENPVGLLSTWLGTPRDVWQPHEFGDAWTKRTALWGTFKIPERGPFVAPEGSIMDQHRSPARRAVTPAGFARAFFEANP